MALAIVCTVVLVWVVLGALLAIGLGHGLRRADVLGPSRRREERRPASAAKAPNRFAATG